MGLENLTARLGIVGAFLPNFFPFRLRKRPMNDYFQTAIISPWGVYILRGSLINAEGTKYRIIKRLVSKNTGLLDCIFFPTYFEKDHNLIFY